MYSVLNMPTHNVLLLWDSISRLLTLSKLEDSPKRGWLMDERLPSDVRGNDVFLKLHELEGWATL